MGNWIALFSVMALAIASSVLVMIYGWGLTPKSWWWIIGVGLFGQMVIRVLLDRLDSEIKAAKHKEPNE